MTASRARARRGWIAAALAFGAAVSAAPVVGASWRAQDGAARADAIVAQLTDDAPDDDAALLGAGFDAFVERMDAFDAERALALARAMFDRSPAVWSAFCLEGALRRGAPADLESEAADAAHAEASAALEALLATRLTPADRLAVVQRQALLHAGFDRPVAERRVLGAALGMGGYDGIQIMALKGLSRDSAAEGWSAASPETAGALFASLLDRGAPDPTSPQAAPWALRGHGLASLERALR